ncbi:MAG: hypothetical protein ACKOE6_05935 [Flammeovirgaceae bacterium]
MNSLTPKVVEFLARKLNSRYSYANTPSFYFKSFDERDTLDLKDDGVTMFKSRGTWRKIGDDIELTFKKSKENFNCSVIFESEKNKTVTVNDSTFKFNKHRETITLWGLNHTKVNSSQQR